MSATPSHTPPPRGPERRRAYVLVPLLALPTLALLILGIGLTCLDCSDAQSAAAQPWLMTTSLMLLTGMVIAIAVGVAGFRGSRRAVHVRRLGTAVVIGAVALSLLATVPMQSSIDGAPDLDAQLDAGVAADRDCVRRWNASAGARRLAREQQRRAESPLTAHASGQAPFDGERYRTTICFITIEGTDSSGTGLREVECRSQGPEDSFERFSSETYPRLLDGESGFEQRGVEPDGSLPPSAARR